MSRVLSLAEAVESAVRDGDTVALEGFTHLIPHAAGHEIIRQKRKRLTLVRMTPDLIYDQMIGMGCAEKAIFSWGGNPGVGSLHRFRDAVENGWPNKLAIEEHSHAAMANAYDAGAAGLPLAVLRGYVGADLPKVNPNIKSITCPFTGEKLAAVPAIRPDVGIVHAQKADCAGNVMLEGIVLKPKLLLESGRFGFALMQAAAALAELDDTLAGLWYLSLKELLQRLDDARARLNVEVLCELIIAEEPNGQVGHVIHRIAEGLGQAQRDVKSLIALKESVD